eukprot:2375605-Rhodomonas_salina.3
MKAKEMDDQFGGEPVQVRVTQNKEPSHFLRLFKGSFIVHDGGNPSGFKTGHPDLDHHDGTGLYHVRGHSDITTRAVQVVADCVWRREKRCLVLTVKWLWRQVDKEAASLNSCDAFVLRLHDTIYAWYGRKCTLDERATSKKCADILRESRKEVEVEEGNEPAEFWAELGGKKEYPEGAPDEDEAHPPRLFQCSNASGTFEVLSRAKQTGESENGLVVGGMCRVVCVLVGVDAAWRLVGATVSWNRGLVLMCGVQVEEVVDFAQDDLSLDDTFILDDWKEVFVWVGSEANELEKRKVCRCFCRLALWFQSSGLVCLPLRPQRSPRVNLRTNDAVQVMELAQTYVESGGDARKGTPVMRVDAGKEPPLFTCHFLGWDHHKAQVVAPTKQLKRC